MNELNTVPVNESRMNVSDDDTGRMNEWMRCKTNIIINDCRPTLMLTFNLIKVYSRSTNSKDSSGNKLEKMKSRS